MGMLKEGGCVFLGEVDRKPLYLPLGHNFAVNPKALKIQIKKESGIPWQYSG